MKATTKTIFVRVSPALHAAIRQLAFDANLSINRTIVRILEEHVGQNEAASTVFRIQEFRDQAV